jgi:hypothetical protein
LNSFSKIGYYFNHIVEAIANAYFFSYIWYFDDFLIHLHILSSMAKIVIIPESAKKMMEKWLPCRWQLW